MSFIKYGRSGAGIPSYLKRRLQLPLPHTPQQPGYALRRRSEARTRARNCSGVSAGGVGAFRFHHGGPRDILCFLRGLTRRELSKPPGRQVLRLGVDRFGRRAVKADPLVIAKYGLAIGWRHFPAAEHAE